jgi:hypothetical protein
MEPVVEASAQHLPAGKIHVLGVEPLKIKLGSKWERLSGLVHKLFETAIVKAQSADDHFIRLDDMSYAVVFNSLSFEEAECMCSAIAKEVCQSLFGDQIDEVSVRSVVAKVVAPSPDKSVRAGRLLESLIERSGSESVFSQSTHSGLQEPVAVITSRQLGSSLPATEQIDAARKYVEKTGVRMGFVPIWELQRNASSSLRLSLLSKWAGRPAATGVGASFSDNVADEQIAETEIVQLDAAVAYAARLAECGKVCAVVVTVSYRTLSVFKLRIRYITALQRSVVQQNTPLVLRIGQIPEGTPGVRIGELAAMMSLPGVRVTLQLQSLQNIPTFDFRLGAVGLGGTLPKGASADEAAYLLGKLVHTAQTHKIFAFVDDLETREMVKIARHANVRFATGPALCQVHFSGLEDVPDFPLMVEDVNPQKFVYL